MLIVLAVATAASGTNLPTRGDILWDRRGVIRDQRERGRNRERERGERERGENEEGERGEDLGNGVEDQSCSGGPSSCRNKRNGQIPVSVSE